MSSEDTELQSLRQRIRQLEAVEQEYANIKRLIDQAAKDENLKQLAVEIVFYAQQGDGLILGANAAALEFLGYTLDEILTLRVPDLEVPDSYQNHSSYIESSTPVSVYDCRYRHRTGTELAVVVHKWLLVKTNTTIWHYTLEPKCLWRQVLRELNRREDAEFQFREKLKTLNEIAVQLGRSSSFDEVCRQGVKLGTQKLGFDRLSLWFIDQSAKVMRGTYGVDEEGNLRNERGQSWSYEESYVDDFRQGRRDPVIIHDDAPLYNDKSEIIGYGWHISAPILDGDDFIGFLGADNFIHRQPLKDYQPELLRLYGATIGHLTSLKQARQKEVELLLEQERVHILESFMANISHEFKTPLAVIDTSLYLLGRVNDQEKRSRYLSGIKEQSGYLNRMLDEILEIVKLGSSLELDLKPVRLTSLIQDVVNEFAPLINEKQLDCRIQQGLNITLRVDSSRLMRAISEIVENAILYTPPQGSIHISLHQYAHEVGIAVQDTGIGIPASEHEKIFNRFYRVDQARTTRSTGLGLTIAKLIVEAHHGKITVESTPGQGSRFEIRLPLQPE